MKQEDIKNVIFWFGEAKNEIQFNVTDKMDFESLIKEEIGGNWKLGRRKCVMRTKSDSSKALSYKNTNSLKEGA